MRTRSAALVAGAMLAAACGGVSHQLRRGAEPPRSIAVLPFAGDADPELRAAGRALLQSRLRAAGYLVPEAEWVDRALSERGWLRDPDAFDATALPMAEATLALGVDAIAVGSDLCQSSFNVLLLRRHAVGGRLALVESDGRTYWAADHAASRFGGFLLTSGQVFEELRAQGVHRTPMATLALLDEFVADVAATVPTRAAATAAAPPPSVDEAIATRTPLPDGGQRLVVEARASAGAVLTFALPTLAAGVPMVAVPSGDGRHRGAHDLPPGTQLTRIDVVARDAFGREARTEARP